ncbi:MAG: hypothetical protein AVDCRST_MAG33-1284 [uncultured Thermomicrobiales bacterium]|uniref:Uncharacterized protein n=1 Tax=uncultured Thermomicrobiales bacterium TaxID=1645740 RepID=A0A6J4UTC7_9BACT|nr:MAG: hypothetical protein AVDCRST_MAG33-1284 [uncultured Thermomicrobiales bacterium]
MDRIENMTFSGTSTSDCSGTSSLVTGTASHARREASLLHQVSG